MEHNETEMHAKRNLVKKRLLAVESQSKRHNLLSEVKNRREAQMVTKPFNTRVQSTKREGGTVLELKDAQT